MLTPAGHTLIENLQPGDLVLSRAEQDTGDARPTPQRVEEVFVRAGRLCELVVAGRTLLTTPEHPFFVRQQGWTPAGELQPGDCLSTASGEWLRVARLTDTHRQQTVYNFRVAEYATYFIAPADLAFDVWVHNTYRPRAIDSGHEYEQQIRALYGDKRFAQRQFTTVMNGRTVNGVADNVANIGGLRTAVEAKYVDQWATSLRNPNSAIGRANFARLERRNLVSQARAYANQFDQVIYHSNSLDFISHYESVFQRLGINNIRFVHTLKN